MSTAIDGPTTRRSGFGPLEVAWDERVLEPRPWTLAHSRWAADLGGVAPGGPILELCAGAGHIGLAAAAWTGRPLVQVELDPVAVRFAEANAASNGLAQRVEVRCADLEHALRHGERFPLVLADPPYLRAGELQRFPGDPRQAVDGGQDGLAVVRRCLRVAGAHMPPGGHLLLQVASAQQALEAVGHAPDGLRLDGTRIVPGHGAIAHLVRG